MHRRVQRIRRHRHEHFAVRRRGARQRQLDAFRRAGGDEDAIGDDRPTLRACIRPRPPRVPDAMPGRRPVAVVSVAQRALDRLDEVRRAS